MPYQLPQVDVRIFSGDDGSGSSKTKVNTDSEYNETECVNEAIDVAFVHKVKSLVSGGEAQLERMKTNVSPVLRWVALMHDKSKATNPEIEINKSTARTNESTNISTSEREQTSTQATLSLYSSSSDNKVQEPLQSTNNNIHQTQALSQKQTSLNVNNIITSNTANSNSVLNALSRRGVGFKDPLMERLKRRMLKEQRMQESTIASSNNNNSSTDDNDHSHAKSMHTIPSCPVVVPSIAPTHWTERRLSEMQNSSWSIFREQVGILIEVYNRRHELHESNLTPLSNNLSHMQELPHAQGEPLQVETERNNAIPSSIDTSSFTLPRFTIDTIHPIRCWEEARLPYALGKCVSHNYGFPTAVQCMCVPLANAIFVEPETTMTKTTTRASTKEDTTMHHHHPYSINTSPSSYIHKIDVLAVAETGSGKTAAYIIPILTDILLHRPKLLDDPERISLGPFSLVLVPTRELAEQVTREFNKLLHGSSHPHTTSHKRSRQYDQQVNNHLLYKWEKEELAILADKEIRESYAASHNLLSEIRVVKVTGGESTESQFEQLSHGAHVVIGTVGQLSALLQERLLSLGNTQMVVIDEADRMIDDDYTNSLRNNLIEVLDRCPAQRQTLLFTATLSAECTGIAKKYLSPMGYYIVRTPQRCASIVQNFEVVPCTPLEWVATENNNSHSDNNNMQMEDRQRTLHRLIHPTKFNRLVSWLAYCPLAPIVVFANEKKVCDALQEELRNERTHLHELEQEFDLYSLLGPSP